LDRCPLRRDNLGPTVRIDQPKAGDCGEGSRKLPIIGKVSTISGTTPVLKSEDFPSKSAKTDWTNGSGRAALQVKKNSRRKGGFTIFSPQKSGKMRLRGKEETARRGKP